MLSLLEVARALGGQVARRQVLAPGPGHSARDRSLSVKLADHLPGGFLVVSHAADDWKHCRDYVAERLGLPRFGDERQARPDPAEIERHRAARERADREQAAARAKSERRARELLAEGRDPRGTIAERYLRSRSIEIPEHMAGTSIRFHPACPWIGEDGAITRVPAMLAPLTSLATGQVVGCHRTALTAAGEKLARKVLGTAAGAAIKLEPAADTLAIGEGLETCLSARALGFRPVWAAYSVNEVARLPLIDGVRSLVLLGERDKTGASARAVERCGARWHAAGCSVTLAMPLSDFGDFNDQIRGVQHEK
jgi:hypothetical protein